MRFELDRPENFGLKRGWKVIEQVSLTTLTPAKIVHTLGVIHQPDGSTLGLLDDSNGTSSTCCLSERCFL